jgi:hypothetical protein
MKYFVVVIIFCLSLLQSCNNKAKTKIVDNILEIDSENFEEIKLSDYVSNVKVVKLETSSDIVIGEIMKVQIFDNKIYILDRIYNALYVFDENGKFLHLLRKIGQGPGEYTTLWDFVVTDKGLYLSDMSIAILYYDHNFNFVRKITHYTYGGIFITDDDFFWLYQLPNLSSHNQLVMFDKTGRRIKEFFPQKASKDGINLFSSNSFQIQGNDKYFSPQFGYTIYKLDETNEWQKFVTFLFLNKTFTGDVNEYFSKYSIAPGDPDFPYIVRRDFSVFSNLFMIDFDINLTPYCCFYNLKTKETRAGKVKNDLIPDYESIFPIKRNSHGNQTGNFLIEFIEAEWILNGNHKGLCKLNESLKNLKEDDNPVLVIYEFK